MLDVKDRNCENCMEGANNDVVCGGCVDGDLWSDGSCPDCAKLKAELETEAIEHNRIQQNTEVVFVTRIETLEAELDKANAMRDILRDRVDYLQKTIASIRLLT